MSRYFYKAWLRDAASDPGEADDQWWIGMIIEADTPAKASDWGDKLAKDYCTRFLQNRFVTSEVSLAASERLASLDFPVVRYGEKCSDKKLGW